MTIDDFQAFRIHNDGAGYRAGMETLSLDDLSPGEVVVRAAYSSVNYKDALAGTGKGSILRRFPLVGGIDVAGHVVASSDPSFKEGDAVVCTGCGLSETRDGGYSPYVRLPAAWTIALPAGLSLEESMILGTAGFTAALGLYRMRENRQQPDMGPIAVTGATGGVGMLAVDIFTRAGFDVHAVSGKAERFSFLRQLGAETCLSREQIDAAGKALASVRFGGALDTVGGTMLASLLALTTACGNVASCGLVASAKLPTTVMPFIIRGVSLLGIASAGTARAIREQIWQHLASDWKPEHLHKIHTNTCHLSDLPNIFENMTAGKSFGRSVVSLG